MLNQSTEAQLRAAIVRFIDDVKNTTGDHHATVAAHGDPDTADACKRMTLTVSWSDRMGNTRNAVRSFLAEPLFKIARFQTDLDAFACQIHSQARDCGATLN